MNVIKHKLQWINKKDAMYPSDKKIRIKDYGTILLRFVTKPSSKRQSYNKMMEINN